MNSLFSLGEIVRTSVLVIAATKYLTLTIRKRKKETFILPHSSEASVNNGVS
jgi:hypothetical protein